MTTVGPRGALSDLRDTNGREGKPMKFSAPTAELAELAGWVARAIGSFSSSPILGGIRLRVAGTEITLTAFNYDSLHTGSIVGIVEEPGEILIPGDRFANLLSRLRGPVVDVSLAEGWLELACKATRAKFHLMNLSEYPATSDRPAVTSDAQANAVDLQLALASLTPVASREPGAKAWETGVRVLGIEDKGLGLYCGNRPRGILGRTFVPAETAEDFEVLAPAKQLSDAVRQLMGNLSITLEGGNIHLATEDHLATLRSLAGEFPASVESIFKPAPEVSVKIEREALVGSLKLIESGGDQVAIKLTPDGLELASANSSPDNIEGAVSDVVECQASIDGADVYVNNYELWANLKNLQLALSGLTSEMIELDFLPKRQLGVRDSATQFVMSTLRPPEERKINV